MTKPKRVGILTSGGDCGGLNAVIRAVVRRARDYDIEIYGIKGATQGLLNRPVEAELLDMKRVSGILRYGGTILGTVNKGNPFAYPMPDGKLVDRSEEVIDGYHKLGLDALIGIGGDGSLAILRRLAQQGNMNLVAVPKTIDNDLGATENSIGFNTAVSVAVEALDRLTYTAISHSRVMILEVMGRDAGHIAVSAGIAGGAHVVLIPEIPYNLDEVCDRLMNRAPSPLDRILGATFGVAAVDLIAEKKYDRMVAWVNREVIDVPIADAIAKYRAVDVHGTLIRTAVGLGTYVGEIDQLL